jgi:hypothetical protein
MAWVRPSLSKPRRSRPGQGRFNCGESGEACGWVPSPGGPEPVGAAGVRVRDGHGAGGCRHRPFIQCHRWFSPSATTALQPLSSRSHLSPTPTTAPAPAPAWARASARFAWHSAITSGGALPAKLGLARRPARPWRPSSPSIGSNTCGSPLTRPGSAGGQCLRWRN